MPYELKHARIQGKLLFEAGLCVPVPWHMINECVCVQLVVRQILPDMPQICHGEQRVAYKHGLWLVRGEIIPPSARPNISTVLSLSPND